MSRLRIGVIFGGRSGEHEVSLMSAKSIVSALDPERYEVITVGITKEGKWVQTDQSLALEQGQEISPIVPDPTVDKPFDVVFPVLHGTYGEDGTIQGLLELANIAYVGAGVAGSAASMDKGLMRSLFANAGLPLLNWEVFTRYQWESDPDTVLSLIEERLGYPCFVKPANLGSSVGINKATNREELVKALNEAAEFDRRLVVEQAANKPREIECSVLGNEQPIASIPGEIVPGNEFYDYQDKYISEQSQLIIPARLSLELEQTIQEYAIKAYQAVDCAGMARVDFFLDVDGQIYINEINTIPGFTKISMYPKLWEATGISFSQLLDNLIELALDRHRERNRNRTSI
ncbi:MAG: D-alanine--D-alanine ligase [Firmicutes bacterium]|nr:D-alanine--D-alanine ligase [Bacillota bacterium]